MSPGYIDSASLYGVIAALTYRNVESIPAWTIDSALATTALLASNPTLQVQIAPSPCPRVGAYGLYDRMRRALPKAFVYESKPEKLTVIKAIRRLKRWVRRNPARLKQIWLDTQRDPSFAKWLEWSIKYAWVPHAAMEKGLFDSMFVPEVALLLNTAETELYRILELTQKPSEVEQWVREDLRGPECQLAVQAYVLSALLRGRFHDHLAEVEGLQIMHHPLRDRILPYKPKSAVFVGTNSEVFFTKILLFSPLCERNIEDRIALWADNIIKTRRGIDDIDLSQKHSELKAIDEARKAVGKLDLRVYPRWVEWAIDKSADAIIGGLITLLCRWVGMPPLESGLVSVISDIGLKELVGQLLRGTVGSKTAARLYGRAKRLSGLAMAGPGRIERGW